MMEIIQVIIFFHSAITHPHPLIFLHQIMLKANGISITTHLSQEASASLKAGGAIVPIWITGAAKPLKLLLIIPIPLLAVIIKALKVILITKALQPAHSQKK